MILNTLRPKPVFNHEMCISCGDCKRSCPPGIIDMSSGKPVPDLSKCIRCFCCHELCPKKAVDIRRHWIYDKVLKK
jgi:MinD superfamily P-loop ATPase